jgi:hypothetical protein
MGYTMGRDFSKFLTRGCAIGLLTLLLGSVAANAQTAVRCDVNGKSVYSDQPCQSAPPNKAAISTQETPEQRAAAKAANDQIRKDNLAVDKRLDDRFKRDSAHSAPRGAASNVSLQRDRTVLDGESKPKKARKTKKTSAKAKATKATKAEAAGKTKAKKDGKMYRTKSRV